MSSRVPQAVGVFVAGVRVCRTLSEMVIIKSPRFGSYWNFFQKKNLHIASVNFASFVCPKVTNQPSGAFSRNFVLHSFTKFC